MQSSVQLEVIGEIKGIEAKQPLLLPIVQSELHPSPSYVLLSSHSSLPNIKPSPQIASHLLDDKLYPSEQTSHVS